MGFRVDTPETEDWIKRRPVRKGQRVWKHYGPGPHPGTGTSQDVHGGGGGSTRIPSRRPSAQEYRRSRQVLGIRAGDHYSEEVHAARSDAQEEIRALMKEDPRWEEAEKAWQDLQDPDFEMIVHEGMALQSQVYDLYSEATGWDGDWGAPDNVPQDPWGLEEGLLQLTSIDEKSTIDIDSIDDPTLIPDIEELLATRGAVYSTFIGKEEGAWMLVEVDGEWATLMAMEPEGSGLFIQQGVKPAEWVNPSIVAGGVVVALPESYKGAAVKHVPLDSLFVAEPDSWYMEPPGFWERVQNLREAWNAFEANYGITVDNVEEIEAFWDGVTMGSIPSSITNNPDVFVVNDSFNSTGLSVIRSLEEAPEGLRNLWANTAADQNGWALAVQRAVAEEFDLPVEDNFGNFILSTGSRGDALATSHKIMEKYGTGLKVWARATYNRTQQYLDLNAIEVLPLMRGQKTYADEPGDRELSEQGIVVGRPAHGSASATTVSMNPLSSWSVEPSTARRFGRYRYETWVPAEKVFGLSILGNGAYREEEVIVLGGADSTDVWRSDGFP